MDEGLIQRIVAEVVRRVRGLEAQAPATPSDPPVKLVTEERVARAIERGEGSLPVAPNAIVTPLAQDLLRQSSVRLVENSGREQNDGIPGRSTAIALGSDRRGAALGPTVREMVLGMGREIVDVGTSDSYVQVARSVAQRVATDRLCSGIVIDGEGAPSAIVANKVKGIRAVACHDVTSAKFARAHADANVQSLGVVTVGDTVAREIVKTWLSTPFEGGEFVDRVREIEEPDGRPG